MRPSLLAFMKTPICVLSVERYNHYA
ncbi:hypothetical protein LEMLEM_LOCUS1341 [Lemmus lemmus]